MTLRTLHPSYSQFPETFRRQDTLENGEHFIEAETNVEERRDDRLFNFGARIIVRLSIALEEVSCCSRYLFLRCWLQAQPVQDFKGRNFNN